MRALKRDCKVRNVKIFHTNPTKPEQVILHPRIFQFYNHAEQRLFGDDSGDALYGGGTRRSSGLDSVEHALADLLGVELEGLNAIGGGRGGGIRGGKGFPLDLVSGGGGFVG